MRPVRKTETARSDRASGEEPLRIGDLARRVGVTTRTLRFYEALGLIQPARRTRGGFRLYGAEQADRLKAVLALKEVGFSLEEIRAYQQAARRGELALDVVGRLREKIHSGAAQVRARIARLEEALADLESAEAVLDRCTGCERKSFDEVCHDCWCELSGGECPWALKAVIPSAESREDGA